MNKETKSSLIGVVASIAIPLFFLLFYWAIATFTTVSPWGLVGLVIALVAVPVVIIVQIGQGTSGRGKFLWSKKVYLLLPSFYLLTWVMALLFVVIWSTLIPFSIWLVPVIWGVPWLIGGSAIAYFHFKG